MFMFNGIGTRLYGHTQVEAEGVQGYIATKFFCVMWVPFIPIRSYMVVDEGDDTELIVYSSKSYHLIPLADIYRPHYHFLWWAVALGLLSLVLWS